MLEAFTFLFLINYWDKVTKISCCNADFLYSTSLVLCVLVWFILIPLLGTYT